MDDGAGSDIEFYVEFFDSALGVATQVCFPTLIECKAAEADLEAADVTITAECRPVR
ncbi:MAG: hypothetical protein M3264_02760 [Thermoproteota archaeon]|nr:hypothetical protein [Thermoproteota archaeon]